MIAALYWSMNIPGQVAMREGLEAQVKIINEQAQQTNARGIKLIPRIAGDGAEGIEKQIQQMYEMVALRPDAIVIQPTDNAALAKPLRAANRAKIPVIAYDQYIDDGELAAYISSDNFQAGVMGGEYVAAHFDNQKPIRLILVEYPHVSSTVERVNGFLDALSGNQQKYQILKTYEAVEPISGQRAGERILADFPQKDSVDVVFTVNDGGGLNVVEALAKAGRNEIFVATIDGDPKSVENIRKNRLTRIDSAQFCGPLGAEAIKAAYNVLRDQPTPRYALIPTFPITRETLSLYPGWAGPIPQDFKKPWSSLEPMWRGQSRVVIP
ncbi:putative D-ribose-binding periplasmic protein precursor [Magnetofaba australis IT-1]|uniref:Putative D-ribose-binding periplasmic protein n=2 Tax=Magnetofaba TaxID=1472292 RepID=A0A1Y2JZQ8_9PROT|nr:putative D-ribose-binding periplasmic protein precursor [Magnetofaba australis IT-1]